MKSKALTRGEQVLVALVVVTLLPIAAIDIAFVVFGQGTPLFTN